MLETARGRLLRRIRMEQKVSLEKLAHGLCSKQALSNIERGNVQADKLLTDIVLQRLGKSVDGQEMLLSRETYQLEETLDQLEESIQKGERARAEKYQKEFARLIVKGKNKAAAAYTRAEESVESFTQNGAGCRHNIWGFLPRLDRVREMYWHRVRAEWAYWLEKDVETAKRELFAATELTMPGWTKQRLEYYAISTVEMENLLALAKLSLIEQIKKHRALAPALRQQKYLGSWELPESAFLLSDGERGRKLLTLPVFLRECLQYIRKSFTDGQERAKIFAKCAWLLSYIEAEQGNLPEACAICEEAAGGLCNYGFSVFLIPVLMRLFACCGRADKICAKANMESQMLSYAWQRDWQGLKARFGHYLTALRHIYKKCDFAWNSHVSIFAKSYQKSYHLDYEFIRGERLARGITREKVSEGIYQSEKSLWKLETGKKRAHGEKFQRLLVQLLEDKYTHIFPSTDSYEVMELKEEMERCLGRKEYDKARELLRELEGKLDMDNTGNCRSLLSLRWFLEFRKDDAICWGILKHCWELLKMTYHVADGVEREGIPYIEMLEQGIFYRAPMQGEAILLNQIALLLCRLGRDAEAKALYQALIKSMQKSDVALRYRYKLYALPYGNLAKCLYSASMSREAIRYELACGKLNSLGFSLMVWACAIENDSPDRAESREMVLDAYYLCELSKNYKYRDEIKRYHNDVYGLWEPD